MKNEKGFTLIEVMIALLLLGIIAVAFLGALATASRALIIADERATAESLARSQMEYVKSQAYITAPDSGEVIYPKIAVAEIPDGYTIMSVDRTDTTVTDIIGVPWDTDPLVNQPKVIDDGIQRIKLVISHHDKEVITLENYKVDR